MGVASSKTNAQLAAFPFANDDDNDDYAEDDDDNKEEKEEEEEESNSCTFRSVNMKATIMS